MTKSPKSERAKFVTRRFILSDPDIVARAVLALQNAPVDPLRPLEFVLREEVKARKPDQNALMHAGPIKDLAEQAWVDGRQFGADVWHTFLKTKLLPEAYDPDLTLENYVKWAYDPAGEPIMVGSTKMLTVRGFSEYLEAVFSFGSNLGVEWSAAPPKGF